MSGKASALAYLGYSQLTIELLVIASSRIAISGIYPCFLMLTCVLLILRRTIQVAVNEDPRTRLIRELRAEVAFLRSQLAAVAGPDAAAALIAASPHALTTPQQQQQQHRAPRGPAGQAQGSGGTQGGGLQVQVSPHSITGRPPFQLGGSSGHQQQNQKAPANSKGVALGGKHTGGEGAAGGRGHPGPARGGGGLGTQESSVDSRSPLLPAGTSMEDLKAALIKSTQQDVDVLAQKLLDAVSGAWLRQGGGYELSSTSQAATEQDVHALWRDGCCRILPQVHYLHAGRLTTPSLC